MILLLLLLCFWAYLHLIQILSDISHIFNFLCSLLSSIASTIILNSVSISLTNKFMLSSSIYFSNSTFLQCFGSSSRSSKTRGLLETRSKQLTIWKFTWTLFKLYCRLTLRLVPIWSSSRYFLYVNSSSL